MCVTGSSSEHGSRDHGSPTRRQHNAALSLDEEKEQPARHHGRITPPATTIPKFRKYAMDDFQFLKVLGKGSFGKVGCLPLWFLKILINIQGPNYTFWNLIYQVFIGIGKVPNSPKSQTFCKKCLKHHYTTPALFYCCVILVPYWRRFQIRLLHT